MEFSEARGIGWDENELEVSSILFSVERVRNQENISGGSWASVSGVVGRVGGFT